MSITFKGNLTEHFTQIEYHKKGDAIITRDTLIFADCLEDFRVWLRRKMIVHAWFRTLKENRAARGISSSNHLKGCACDFHVVNITIDRARFIKYATKWAQICKAHGKTGEAGLYTWGVHFGIQNADQEQRNNYRFYHWDSRTGDQINKPFAELNLL